MSFKFDVDGFIGDQLAGWPQAAERFEALKSCMSRKVKLGDGTEWRVSFNPARIVSSAAKTDAKSIAARPCFLCDSNRPAEQKAVEWNGYKILVNPFPIFPRHLTIVAADHTPQLIAGRGGDMARLALTMPDCTIFYNGPRCGASAPDHFHFQAAGKESLPLRDSYPFATIRFKTTPDEAGRRLDAVMSRLPLEDDAEESPVNILCAAAEDGEVEFVVIPRRRHRPANFGHDEGQLLLSPASVDLAGVMVAPRLQEWERIDASLLSSLFDELCYTDRNPLPPHSQPPLLEVGILSAEKVTINFENGFEITGNHTFGVVDGEVVDLASGLKVKAIFPTTANSRFTVKDVMIGIGFHWQQHLDQTFSGRLKLIADGSNVVVVNIIDVEEYLVSVISSEMAATASPQLLRAHAIISRSWVMAQLSQRDKVASTAEVNNDANRYITYTDREAHSLFDICADDHCQRYQGVTRVTSPEARKAVEATRGMVLTDKDGDLCDARFSKCCGGVMELFSSCWQDHDPHYLQPLRDNPAGGLFPADLRIESNAREFITRPPEGDYCNCTDPKILSQVLNNFDRATTDFYRWEVSYGVNELSELIARRSGIDFGEILELRPLRRGPSGRIIELEIIGTKLAKVIGKELTIRRWLSESHLRSSAFVVERRGDRFILRGAGWGHGVGLCQIGAAVMGARGIDYRKILAHYYPGSNLVAAY